MATEYFVPSIWPKRRLNLVFGPSGAGKTYWLLPQIYALMAGEPVLGHPTKPVKIAYVCCDRSSEDANETIEKLGFDPRLLPKYSFMDNDDPLGIDSVIRWLPLGTELLVVEAIAGLLPGNGQNKISDYHAIMGFGRIVNRFMRTWGASFWGTTHSPKLKKDEAFLHNRDNALGSALWGGICGTMIEIQYDEKSQQRMIRFMTRHDEPYTEFYEFNDSNRLVSVSEGTANVILNLWLNKITSPEITTAQAIEMASSHNLSEITAKRWLSEKEDEGRLFRVKRGIYTIRPKQ